jgi:protein SCO1
MKRQGIHWIRSFLLAALLMTAGNAFGHEPQSLLVQRREAHIRINDFFAVDQTGRNFEFNSLSGKTLLVTFVYTSCPDVCPLITAAARQVQIRLSSAERSHVRLLTITTDPETDVPKILLSYAARYDADFANWLFLTGDTADLKKIWKNFGVGVKRKARGLIDHTPLTAIVDKKGIMRVAYIGPSPDPKQMLTDLRRLLSER